MNAVLEGNFSMDLHELPSAQPKVGVFVSSTFTDTKAERNILMRGKLSPPSFLASIGPLHLGLYMANMTMRPGNTEIRLGICPF